MNRMLCQTTSIIITAVDAGMCKSSTHSSVLTVFVCAQVRWARERPLWLQSYRGLKSTWKDEVWNTSTSVSTMTILTVTSDCCTYFFFPSARHSWSHPEVWLYCSVHWQYSCAHACVSLDHTRCNAWVLDGDLYHKGLQGVAVPVDSISDTLLLITVDMSRPWNALDSLQKWGAVAREHIDKLRVPPETLRELEQRRESH